MQSIRICLFITALLCLTPQVTFAEEVQTDTVNVEKSTKIEDSSSSITTTDLLSEIIIRPVAVVASATGLAIFILASPFTGLASIPEPHDVFATTWQNLVVTPYHFAFRRPFGDYSVDLYDKSL